jgi:hypothetical protein
VPDPVPITWHQVAPFFLEYEEWLSGRHFFPENAYVLRPTFTVPSSYGKALQDQIDLQVGEPAMWPETVWFKHVQAMAKHLEDAYASFDLGEYPAARTSFEQARSAAQNALVETPFSPKDATDLYHLGDSLAAWLHPLLQDLMALDLTDLDGVAALTEFFAFRDPDPDYPSPNADQGEKGGSGFDFRDHLQAWALSLLHLYLYVLPAYLAETAVRMGDFPGAMAEFARTTGFLVARAEPTDAAGDLRADDEMVRAEGRLPYTADLRAEDESAAFKVAAYYLGEDGLARRLIPNWTHPVERRLLRLRYGAAILEWADSLYRADDEAATARARELYKAVLYLHGDPPPLDPNWSGNELAEIIALTGGAVTVKPHTENPDLTSQKARATAELLKIEAGLNFYGADDRLVPSQRFRVLKSAADRFAASAKAAQQDFLLATSNIEASIRERIVATNMLRKAKIQAQIADEQRAIAEFAVAQDQRQVDQINAAIEAKKAEIADHDSFGTAFVDWATGFKKNLDALPKEATSNLSSAYSSGAFSMSGDAGSGGAAAAEGGSSASASLGVAGAWIAVGYAAAQSLVSWSDAQDQREKELHALEYDALPWAQQQVAATQHGVAIAQLQRQLAEADADLASDLLRFESERLLNAEFWAAVVGVMQRVMRRYLDLGGRFAWLAERALAYEQDRNISLVRFNYFPAKLGGVTGADLLELDLAELEAAWADGLRETLPITRTYSLALDFPAAFAQLRKTGSCGFLTTEAPYRISHPGTYRHRIRAVTVAVQSLAPIGRMRGLLTNRGVSTLSRSDGTTHSSVRYPDALPLTEFDLRRDLAAFGDGDGTMRSFEGSGVETFWELELPAAANPYGMDQIADVLITIDAAASWSPSLHELDESSAPTTAHRSVIISAGAQSPDAADQLENAAALSLPFDLTKALLPSSESIRTITNLALFLVGSDASTTASFGTANAPGTEFAFDKGIAASNAPPLSDGSSPTPLSTFVAQPVEQVFELVMSNQDGLRDVVLLIEYEATLAT